MGRLSSVTTTLHITSSKVVILTSLTACLPIHTLYIKQPKPSAAPTPSATATSTPTPAAAAAAAAPAVTPSQPVQAAYPSPAAGTAGVAAGRPATDRTGLNPEHVSQLTDMGFPEDQAVAALRAAMGNPDVAVEFLMTGIPDHTQVRINHVAAVTTQIEPVLRSSVSVNCVHANFG